MALGFVGEQDDRLVGAAHELRKMPIGRRQAGARVDHEQDRVAIDQRRFGLRAHAPGERLAIALFEPGGVDDRECEIAEPRVALAPVARHAGRVVDQRELAADQPVEQRRFADIGPADNGDFGAQLLAIAFARSFCRRLAGSDEAEQQFRVLPHALRRLGIGDDHVEPFAGAVVVLGGERDDAKHFPRGVAIGAGRGRERLERGLGLVGLTRVETQESGAKARGLLKQRTDRGILRKRVIGGDRAARIGLGQQRRFAEPRQDAIAVRRFGGDFRQNAAASAVLPVRSSSRACSNCAPAACAACSRR